MAKWSSAAADSYAEAMRRRYTEPAESIQLGCTTIDGEAVRRRFRKIAQRNGYEAAIKDKHGEHVTVVDARPEFEAWRASVEIKRPEIFAHDPDEPERLRRVFAAWDFRNGT